jgi:hypothetical protein
MFAFFVAFCCLVLCFQQGTQGARLQSRLAKMRHLVKNVEKCTGVGCGLSRQALSALMASISHVEQKQRWSKDLKIQV